VNWIKCSEQMPPFGTRVMVIIKQPLLGLDDKYFYYVSFGKFCCEGEWKIVGLRPGDKPIYWATSPVVPEDCVNE